ncbi:hypothetical protein ZOSMA_107G00190 [Zostera marina]|uniref:Uncharacterized protein n=1 Tax=Zostera marina TaxID=29655 RepID=A0A0K9Q405_ZOSMR|nr:hypothetical protein ZOSMA_107G00190 [Zostera marina]
MVHISNHLGAQASPEHQSLSSDAKHWRSSMEDVDHRRMPSTTARTTANTSNDDPNIMATRPPPTMWSCRSQCNIYYVIAYFSLSDFAFNVSYLAYRVITNSSINILIATLQLLIKWLRPSFQTWYQSGRRSHSEQNPNQPTTMKQNTTPPKMVVINKDGQPIDFTYNMAINEQIDDPYDLPLVRQPLSISTSRVVNAHCNKGTIHLNHFSFTPTTDYPHSYYPTQIASTDLLKHNTRTAPAQTLTSLDNRRPQHLHSTTPAQHPHDRPQHPHDRPIRNSQQTATFIWSDSRPQLALATPTRSTSATRFPGRPSSEVFSSPTRPQRPTTPNTTPPTRRPQLTNFFSQNPPLHHYYIPVHKFPSTNFPQQPPLLHYSP